MGRLKMGSLPVLIVVWRISRFCFGSRSLMLNSIPASIVFTTLHVQTTALKGMVLKTLPTIPHYSIYNIKIILVQN
jgi:hypothetical protein